MAQQTINQSVERVGEEVQPVMLLSSERSGSNLLRSILDTHSEISAPHPLETGYPWRDIASPATLSKTKRRKLIRDALINKAYSHHPITRPIDLNAVIRRVEKSDNPSYLTIQEALYAEYATQEGKSIWASKNPGIWGCLGDLQAYYDDLKILYLVRDVRDVVLSFKTSNIELFHPYLSANRWREEQKKGIDLLESLTDDQIHLVQYEQLLTKPEEIAEGICGFFDIPFEKEMLYFYETEEAKKAAQSADVFENLSVPIKSDNYGKFHDQLPDEETLITEKIAADEMTYFDYDLVHDEEEIKAFDLTPERYRRENKRLERKAFWRFWRENPREQIQRYLSTSFTAYMLLRYGVFV